MGRYLFSSLDIKDELKEAYLKKSNNPSISMPGNWVSLYGVVKPVLLYT